MQPFRDRRKAQVARYRTPADVSRPGRRSETSSTEPACRSQRPRVAKGQASWIVAEAEARRHAEGQEGSRRKRPARRRLGHGLGIIDPRRIAGAGLAVLSAPPVEAFEIVGGATPVAAMGDDLLTQVMVRHGGGRPGGVRRPAGGVHRPAHRPAGAVHRHPGARPGYRPAARPGYRHPVNGPGYRRPVVVAPRAVWVGRPGWYRWGPGGAIAAGAAIGFVTAATAVSWAGAPPQPGLCWYYTDPSRTQGFWDACP